MAVKKVTLRKPAAPAAADTGGRGANPSQTVTAATLGKKYERYHGTVGVQFRPFLRTRRWCTGPAKSGKTAIFVAQAKTAYIDPEGGSDTFQLGPGSVRFQPQTWEEFRDLTVDLVEDGLAGKSPFEHIVLDTVDAALEFLEGWTSDDLKMDMYRWGDGKGGYNKLYQKIQGLERAFYRAGYGWTFLGHRKLRDTPVDGTTIQKMAPSIFPGINARLRADADLLLELKVVPVSVEDPETGLPGYVRRRFISCMTPSNQEWTDVDLGCRVQMDETIELTEDHLNGEGIVLLEAAYDRAVERQRQAIVARLPNGKTR